MNTAKQVHTNYKISAKSEIQTVQPGKLNNNKVHQIGIQADPEILTTGRNARRLTLILEQEAEKSDVFELFGWNELPESIKTAIRPDLEAWRDEILGLYSTCDQGVRDRRKSISYWVKAWRNGICSEETAALSLSVTACA